ncbi:MAG TPA: hypothetical protein VGO48_00405 [Conexibacter sp.]|jgi:tetratricopeptide (TPR) repeat protein|nr:hypothetical protein [Conexibacter sp.]
MTDAERGRVDRSITIGRHAELQRALELCDHPWPLRIIGVEAPGGMGKTTLLAAVRDELRVQGRPVAFIDLAQPDINLPLALERRILSQFEILHQSEAGQRAERVAQDYVAAQGTASAETLQSLRRLAGESAVTAINDAGVQVVILVDTVDRWVSNTTAFRRLTSLLPQLRNASVILAGRATWEVLPALPSVVDVDRSLRLEPLDLEASGAFFEGLDVSPDLQLRLATLADGRPILLRLCAQWLEAGMPLPEAAVDPPSALDTLDDQALACARSDFRRGLVETIRRLRGKQDVLIMEMAHLEHRFNAEIVRYLHPGMSEDADEVLEQLRWLFFVKDIGVDRVVLHDEMRELIREFVWPAVDPLGAERRRLDARIATWYESVLERGVATEDRPVEDRWLLGAEAAFHRLRSDVAAASEEAAQSALAALRAGRIDYAGVLTELTMPLWRQLEPEAAGVMAYVRAEALRAVDRRPTACDVVRESLAQKGLPPAGRLRLRRLMVRLLLEEGDFVAAGEAVGLARTEPESDTNVVRALIDIVDGEVLVAKGMLREAVAVLRPAVDRLEGSDESREAALGLERLSFALSVLGDRAEAVADAKRAVALREHGDVPRDTAISRANLGSILRDGSDFAGATEQYAISLSTLEHIDDRYWVASVLLERGLSRLLEYEQGRYGSTGEVRRDLLDGAYADLSRSVEVCRWYNKLELPKAIHELGHVVWEQGSLDATRSQWHEGLQLARRSSNFRYILENQIGLCELDIEGGDYEAALTHRHAIEDLHELTMQSHVLLWNRLDKLEGEALMALGEREQAIEKFASAVPGLAAHGGWGRYRLDIELLRLRRLIDVRLPADEQEEAIVKLTRQWERAAQSLADPQGEAFRVAIHLFVTPTTDEGVANDADRRSG